MRALALLLIAAGASAQTDAFDPLRPVHEDLAPGLSIHLVPAPFDSTGQVTYGPDGEIVTAGGCAAWYGVDDWVPPSVLREAWVERDGRRLDLDASCMTTCEGCDWSGFSARPLEGTDDWEVGGWFSDGAGTADVAWRVGRVGTVRTRLVAGPELHDAPGAERRRGIRDRLDVLAEGLSALRDDGADTDDAALAGELYEILMDLAALLQDE